MTKSSLRTFLFASLLWLPLLALAQDDNPVSVELEVYVVSEVGGEERFTEATTARPGQVIEYRLLARNEGDTTLPAGTVVVTGPILEGTTFVPNSATPSSESILTEYTLDNEVFGEPPLVITEDGERRVIEPDEYRAIRWTLLEEMEPGDEVSFVYRVVLDRE